MSKFVLAYQGGGMAPTPEEQQQAMEAWGAWFGQLGSAVIDPGAPFAGSQHVGSDGSARDGNGASLTGYSVIEADSLDAAAELAKGCPILQGGGTIDVYEAMPMM